MTTEYTHTSKGFNIHPNEWDEISENSSKVEKVAVFDKIKPLSEIGGANPALLNTIVRNGAHSLLAGTLSIAEYSEILNIMWDSRAKSLMKLQAILPPKVYGNTILHELIDGQISEKEYEILLPTKKSTRADYNAFKPNTPTPIDEPEIKIVQVQKELEQIATDESKGYPKRLRQLIEVAGNMPHIIPIILDNGKDKYLYEVDQITLNEYKEVLRLAQIKRSQFLERCKARFGDDKKSFVEMLDDELVAGRILPEDHIRLIPQDQGTFTHQF